MLTGDSLRQRLSAYREQNWKGVQTPDWQRKIVELQLAADFRPMVQDVLRQYSIGANAKWLDVGSGVGDCVLAARALGIEAFGIEPDRIGVGSNDSSLSIAAARWAREGIFVNGVAESLPFPESYFDIVTLNQVIEHVQDVEKALRSIKVPFLYMPSATDLYFPINDAQYEQAFIPHVTFLPIPSLWGHTAGAASNPADATFLNLNIGKFLAGF